MIYFSASNVNGITTDRDEWIRRKLRKVIWQQLKLYWTRFKALLKRGISEERAVQSCFNQRGVCWYARAIHMNMAYQTSYFEKIGLLSLQKILTQYRWKNYRNRRDKEPYVR